jgi:magnesium transporter
MTSIFVCTQKELKEIKREELPNYINKKNNEIWVHISKPSNEQIILLKEMFKIHPTTIEDVFSQQTSIKYEEFEDYKVVIFKGIETIKKKSVETYNISFIIGENFVITINEKGSDAIQSLLKNDKKIESLLRKGGRYLIHHIMDKEVDKYLKIKSELNDNLNQVEIEFMKHQTKEILTKMYSKELNFLELRHLSESITDLCLNMKKLAEHPLDRDLIYYFKDVYDHALKTTESYKSMLERMNGMEEMYATITSMKTNEAMRSLTIIMALMMPLTIITGFYGMNVPLPFQTHASASLFIFLAMLLSAIVMIIISRRRGWVSKEN